MDQQLWQEVVKPMRGEWRVVTVDRTLICFHDRPCVLHLMIPFIDAVKLCM